MMKKSLALLCAISLIFGLCGCNVNTNTDNTQEQPEPVEETQSQSVASIEEADNENLSEVVLNTPGYEKWDEKIDYSDMDNWLNIPKTIDKEVDVIYYYPTTYSPAEGSGEVIAEIDDEGMRVGAQSMLAKQASAFEDSCNIYAPFYRQIDGTYGLTLTNEQNEELFEYVAMQDAANALDYYFENYNDGRPFILAGHSQGSETLLFLLADYFEEHKDYLDRMVAAYLIGYSVTEDYLADNPHLKFAERKSDTGVIISWNTEGPENVGEHNAVVLDGAISINPLTWTRDDIYVPTYMNLGSRIDGEILYDVADAQIDLERGTVITNADLFYAMPANPLFGPACFHGQDYAFYYNNIQQNAKDRIKEYFRIKTTVEDFDLVGESVDYSDQSNWYKCESDGTKPVDTIYFSPTLIAKPSGKEDLTVDIDDELREAAADEYKLQPVVYEKSTNIYVPLYRQMDMVSELEVSGVNVECLFKALHDRVTRTDVYGALDYYFENYNKGKPFILAGHSQGSALVRIVLDEYMEAHPEYLERMVAAYPIGMGISQTFIDENPHLKYAEGETDTGVIISWNTEGPGATEPSCLVSESDGLCMNPLTWTRDDTYGDKSLNKGSLIDDEIIPNYADAQIDLERHTLVSNGSAEYMPVPGFGDKCLHGVDYKFYYCNLEENVQKRIDSYLK